MQQTLEHLLKNETLIAYLKTQDPNGTYEYYNYPRCGITDYLYKNGLTDLVADGFHITHEKGAIVVDLPPGWNEAVYGKPEMGSPDWHTYGRWLARMEALVSQPA